MKASRSIVIAAHNHLGFEGIASLIAQNPRYRIAGFEDQKAKLIDTLRQQKAHLLIICFGFAGEAANATISDIKQALPSIAIVVISAQPRAFDAVTALYESGANAFLCSTTANQQALFNALDHAVANNKYYTNSYQDQLIESTLTIKPDPIANGHDTGNGKGHEQEIELTPRLGQRETQVLCLIAQGHSAKEVARLLAISKHTVEVHRRNVMIKLNVRKSTELTRYAIENKLIEI